MQESAQASNTIYLIVSTRFSPGHPAEPAIIFRGLAAQSVSPAPPPQTLVRRSVLLPPEPRHTTSWPLLAGIIFTRTSNVVGIWRHVNLNDACLRLD